MSPKRTPSPPDALPRFRLYALLRDQLDRQEIPPGARLPGDVELSRRYGRARGTVRAALAQLEKEGRIARRQGVGTIVLEAPAADRDTAFQSLLENVEAISRRTRVKILRYELTATPRIVLAYDPEFGARALIIERVCSYRGTWCAQMTHFIPKRLSHLLSRRRLGTKATEVAFEKAGMSVAGGEQWVGARAADPRAAAALGVPVGAALLHVRRFVYNKEREIIEYQEALYRPELYQIRMGIEWRTIEGTGKQWAPSAPR